MDIKHFLDRVCNEIKYEPVKSSISEELKLHIQEIKEDYQNQGIEEKEAEEIGKKLNKIHKPKLDWKLLMLIAILMGFGLVVSILKQSTMNNSYIESTIIYMIIGIILSIGVYFFDYRKIKKYSNVIYAIASIVIILSIISKYTVNGVGYIKIFNINIFSPTIAVPLYLLAFIGFIVNYDNNKVINIKIINKQIVINKHLIKIIVGSIVSLYLMIIIPSFTNAVILGISYLIIVTEKIVIDKENCIKKILILYGSLLILMSFIILLIILRYPYIFDRIITSFNPEIDQNDSGWIGMLQKDILENSKLIGEADTKVISGNSDYMIINESNFTFIYLLGKTGILVAGLLVCTIILTSIKLIINAKIVKEQYGKYLIIGISTLYIVQSFATILMNVNMGIQTNVNLPFVTYGSVYFIVNILTIAIIFSVYRRKDIIL